MAIVNSRENITELFGECVNENSSTESIVMGIILTVLLDIRDQNEELLNFVRED